MSNPSHYDVLGVGVGPANLSLASLLHPRRHIRSVFLDKNETFGWHDGQLFPDSSIQVSMVKDLVTLADPRSEFTFLSYLHDKGLMYHFIHADFEAVPRQEFRNYLAWASAKNEHVVFGEEVLTVDFDGVFHVRTSRRRLTANNIVVGVGRVPWVPEIAGALGDDQFHVSDFAEKGGSDLRGRCVCIVGGGQAGAEAFLELISRPEGERPQAVSWVSRRANFAPMDESPFTNDFYMPSHSEYFFALERSVREKFNRRHILTSDGISESTLRAIYQRLYLRRYIEGADLEVSLFPNREVVDVEQRGAWHLILRHPHHPDTCSITEADVIVWATGSCPARPAFLDPIAHRLKRTGDEFQIDRDFAVEWDGPPDRNIFLQNGALTQRGLADKNMSLMAWRSQRIIDHLCNQRGDEPQPSFIEWFSPPVRDGSTTHSR